MNHPLFTRQLPTIKVTRKTDGNGRQVRRCKPVIQRIKYFRMSDGAAVTTVGDVWRDYKKDQKGYVTV